MYSSLVLTIPLSKIAGRISRMYVVVQMDNIVTVSKLEKLKIALMMLEIENVVSNTLRWMCQGWKLMSFVFEICYRSVFVPM